MAELRYSLKKIVPIIFSYIFIGLAAGILMREAGYSPLWSFISALLIYAGSMQIVLVSLLTSGVPLYSVALMTLFINARHIFYGLSFLEDFKKQKGWRYPYMILSLTDETFSLLCALEIPPKLNKARVQFYVQFMLHMLWVASCTLGAFAGSALAGKVNGIEFSATALFTAIVVNQWRSSSSHLPAVSAFISAIIFYFVLGPNNFILPALSCSLLVLVLLKERVLRKEGSATPPSA